MPYLTQEKKNQIHNDDFKETKKLTIDLDKINCGGDLNYLFTILAIAYLDKHGLNYNNSSDVTKAMDNCKDEFYRRLLGPYEDMAIAKNGDVYPDIKTLIKKKGY